MRLSRALTFGLLASFLVPVRSFAQGNTETLKNTHGNSTEQPSTGAHFVGSESCLPCHEKAYTGWKQTRMANVVRDPKQHPDSVLGDFSHQDAARTFSLDDVAFVYGSRYKQRYF